ANQTIVVPSPPQMNDVRLVMSAAPNPDHSWDVGKLERTSDGYIATRPRPEDRPEARRALLGDYMHNAAQDRERLAGIFTRELRKTVDDLRSEHRQDISRLEQGISKNRVESIRAQMTLQDHIIRQTQSAVLFNGVTESYEVVSRALRGKRNPGDVILTAVEKETLKVHGLGYVAQLLNPGKTLTQDIDELRLRALSILSPQQQHLGRVLLEIQDSDGERNILHHPRPDRSTALDRMRTLLDDGAFQTLREYLETDPKHLLSRRERTNHTDVDRYLFEAEGKYSNVASQQEDLDNLRAERADTQAYLEALEAE
ncbi:hypothetical protein DFH09DRAFT_1223738, partial [Mycena vulgaris]